MQREEIKFEERQRRKTDSDKKREEKIHERGKQETERCYGDGK
jgi:hypothetical protein